MARNKKNVQKPRARHTIGASELQLNKVILKFTNSKPFSFIIDNEGRKYDFSVVFAALCASALDIYEGRDIVEYIDNYYGRSIGEKITREYMRNNLKRVPKTYTEFGPVAYNIAMEELTERNIYENIVYDYNALCLLDLEYGIFQDNKEIRMLFALKLTDYLRQITGRQKVSPGIFNMVLDGVYELYSGYVKDVPLKELVKNSCLPETEGSEDFLWLSLVGYMFLLKKYNKGVTSKCSNSLLEMLAERGDYSNAIESMSVYFDEPETEEIVADPAESMLYEGNNEGPSLGKDHKAILESFFTDLRDYIAINSMTTMAAVVYGVKDEEISKLKEETRKLNSEIRKLSKSNNKANKEIESKDKLIVELKEKVNSSVVIAEKDAKIRKLENQLNEQVEENKTLMNKLIGLQNRVKTLEERGTSINDLKNKLQDYESEIERLNTLLSQYESLEEDELKLEDILPVLRERNILFVGGPRTLENRLSEYLNDFIHIDIEEKISNFNVPSSVDCIVIIGTSVTHAHTMRAEKYASLRGIPFIRVSVTNLELMFKMIYKELDKQGNM